VNRRARRCCHGEGALQTALFRRIALALSVILLFAPSGCSRGAKEPSFTPGLGEIMTLTQMRHTKLWFAGESANWDLAEYELDELKEGFEDAATFHPTHKDAELPIPKLIDTIVMPGIGQLEEAVKAHDPERFATAFDELTDGCNRCHQATKFGFNVVTRPSANPYTNQDFHAVH